ncbi:MAG: YgiQ family radical SAM protein, partial [Xanthomonadales bacterium]|nr:YgiQ family radical SAM protein [Xanthomonadales bacterium]
MSKSTIPTPSTDLFGYQKYWAECFGVAPFLPMSRGEMDKLGWDSCDIIIVTGDAYVDHPSFGMAIVGRLLEDQGFRVGIIAQPDWQSADAFKSLGKPNLFYGVAAGNMDSMINRYTAERKMRSDDAYTPGGMGGKRPDRCSLVYSQRCKEAWPDVPVILGGIEASLRRIAHYDYWQDSVRRSILLDATADLLLYGNAERALLEVAHRLARGEDVSHITDIRGTALVRKDTPDDWWEIDSTRIDRPGRVDRVVNPYINVREMDAGEKQRRDAAMYGFDDPAAGASPAHFKPHPVRDRDRTVIRLPSFEKVRNDAVLYAHANRVLHLETNPGNARALVQKHGELDLWVNAPPIPLSTSEMDYVFGMPFARVPHPAYGGEKIPAYEMIRFSVNIMRGCFGGCTFCSITEHEGRIIQNRSEESILNEVEQIRDKVPGFTGVVSDLGGPTANMYRIACKSEE